jgi:hypothetical protein
MLSMILAKRLDELEVRHAPKGIALIRYEGGQWFQRGELIPDDEVLPLIEDLRHPGRP